MKTCDKCDRPQDLCNCGGKRELTDVKFSGMTLREQSCRTFRVAHDGRLWRLFFVEILVTANEVRRTETQKAIAISEQQAERMARAFMGV